MKKIYIISFFLLAQCSLYDLSQNLRLEEILTEPDITLVSPSINSNNIADYLDIDVAFQNVAQGIRELNIIGLTFSSNIRFSAQTKRFSFKSSIPLTNNEQYDSSIGMYPITLRLVGADNNIIESNFVIPIKIKSIHTNSSSIVFPTRPTSQTEWDRSFIKVTPLETGARIRSIRVTGDISRGARAPYITNITMERGFNTINISLRDIEATFIPVNALLSIDLEITSENNGITTISSNYNLTPPSITLVRPSSTTTTITDIVDFNIALTNLQNDIMGVKLITPSGNFSISVPSSTRFFTYTNSIQLSNSTDYHTTNGKYNISVEMTDKKENTIKSNYSIPIKIKSIQTNANSILFPTRPITQAEWNRYIMTINPKESGAGIKSIRVNLTTSTFGRVFNTNITTENSYKSVDIALQRVTPFIINLPFILELQITSVNGGIINSRIAYGSVRDGRR